MRLDQARRRSLALECLRGDGHRGTPRLTAGGEFARDAAERPWREVVA
jgi:hypothetical protein